MHNLLNETSVAQVCRFVDTQHRLCYNELACTCRLFPHHSCASQPALLRLQSKWPQVAWSPITPGTFLSCQAGQAVHVASATGVACTVEASTDPHTGMDAYHQVSRPLNSAPKWLRRPCAARFGWGGKLATVKPPAGRDATRAVVISEVVRVLSAAMIGLICSVYICFAPADVPKPSAPHEMRFAIACMQFGGHDSLSCTHKCQYRGVCIGRNAGTNTV